MNMFDFASFNASAFALGLIPSAIALILGLLITFVIALIQKRHCVIDTFWGLGFVVVAIAAFCFSTTTSEGASQRGILTLILVLIWGVRIAGFIGWRARDLIEDPRYVDLLSSAKGSRDLYAIRRVYAPQGIVLFFVSLTIQVPMYSHAALGFLAYLGIIIWAIGLFFETVGDWQLARFKADPSRKGTVLNTGLWKYTRHPNYFGDAAVWAGLFLVSADAWPGLLTVLSPLLMIWALAGKTGKPLTEQRMSSRAGYSEYIEKTSGFFPLPPKK